MSLKSRLVQQRRRLLGHRDVDYYRRKGAVIGDDVHLGPESWIDPPNAFLVTIGDDVVIAPRVTILAHDASLRRRKGFTRLAPTTIGSRVFIGAGATILPGVTIGDDCVIGAGSVVTTDVKPGSVAVGNPARVVRSIEELEERFDVAFETGPRYNEATPGAGFSPDQWPDVRASVADAGHGWDS